MFKRERTHRVRFLSTVFAIGLGFMAWISGGSSTALAAPNASVGVRAYILNPPDAITDLIAAPVGVSDGDIQLRWTAPSNENGARITGYRIRHATFPATSTTTAEAWWSGLSSNETVINSAFAPGTLEFTTIGGFTLGTTYYFGIKAVDQDNQISPIDLRVGATNQAASQPLNASGPPPTPTNFAGVALTTNSIQWSWNAATGAGFYSIYEFPSDSFKGQTTGLNLTETGFTPNQAISRRLRSGNGIGMSTPTVAITVYSRAAIPTSLSIDSVQFSTITLSWTNGGNPAGTQYRLERSEDGTNYVVAALTTGLSYENGGLSEETTYYYRVLAINGDGIAAGPTVAVSTVTPKKVDFIAPREPLGFKASVDSSHKAFTLSWETVTENEDRTPLTDLAGYHVYRRSTLLGTPTRLTTTPLTVTAFADQVDGQKYFYTVRAIDTSNNESREFFYADSSKSANIIFLGSDNRSTVVMPSEVNDLLRSQFNETGVPLKMVLEEKPVPSSNEIVRSVRFVFTRGDTDEVVTDLSFDRPIASLNVGYNSLNGQVVSGSPSSNNVSAQAVFNATPDDLVLYWHNGVTWIRVGGTVDQLEQVVRTNTSFLGNFQLRVAAAASSLTLNEANVFPRIFSPNGDGLNDRVYFVLENPNSAEVKGEIIDMAGRSVADLLPSSLSLGVGTTLTWDGKDTTGATVPSGVYLYRIKGEGKTFTGTVVVAR